MSYDPNEMMLELFRAEVESHSDSLTSSLLKLEQNPTETGLLEGMMRAAHSIKGAARIVRVGAAVDVAHVMEDCFVAAQRGELELKPSGIDILLRSVDLLGQVSEASKNPHVDWEAFQPAIKSTVSQLQKVLQGQPIDDLESPSNPVPSQTPLQAAKDSAVIESHSNDQLQVIETLEKALPHDSRVSDAAPTNRISIPKIFNANHAELIRVQILSALENQLNHGPTIIDLSLTEEIDSVGLALMHSAARFAATTGRSLRYENATSILSSILQAVGIESVVSRARSGSEGIQDGK